jgi:hypothetical protein
MGTTEDRHTIRITGIECIPVSTVISIMPRWAQSANPLLCVPSEADGRLLSSWRSIAKR